MQHKQQLTKVLFLLLLALILCVATWVRIYKLDWDEGTHLHPDERYLTMVVSALDVPQSIQQYWDTASSPLNPENRGFGGYVYGTLPLFAARVAGTWLDRACGESPAFFPQLIRGLLFASSSVCYPGTYTGYAGVHLVGRYLSTLADLLTLLALVLLARRLFGDRTALLAGALYAFAVLPIQHAHFFVVDSFAAVFVTWTLYFAVSATAPRRGWVLLLAGITTGLAVACKISTWPVAGIVGLAGLLRCQESATGSDAAPCTQPLCIQPSSLLFLFGSGILAALTFRVSQPYAFSGPGFWNVSLSPSWLNTMKFIQQLVSGEIDSPPGHQWTSRLPLVFPWINMVFWGMGLPLGLAAWGGWAFWARDLWRKRWISRCTHRVEPGRVPTAFALPWLWGTMFFLYQALQWVKSMRYLLPTYPVFTLFAAWGLMELRAWAINKRLEDRYPAPLTHALAFLPWIVLAATALWAAAFMQIYARPFTRVEASRWMFENVPTAITVHTDEGLHVQLPVPPNAVLYQEGRPLQLDFTMPVAATLSHLSLNKVHLSDPAQDAVVQVTLSTDPEFRVVHAQQAARISATAGPSAAEPTASASRPPAFVAIPLVPAPSFHVQAGQRLYLELRLMDGAPITLGTSVLGNEHWDDPMPVRIDGRDPFYDWYRGLSSSSDSFMQLYNNDDPAKWQLLHTWLEEVDYIVLSSNRLYGSIARLPQRYPLSVAYYQALFDGSLGFELVSEFVSFPALGHCQFEDQETPFAVPTARYTTARSCTLPYPVAEEAFSVYDHPRVLIFAKTAAYTRERAEVLLPLSLTENAVWITPKQATKEAGGAGPLLLMDKDTRDAQESGGTWSEIFDANAPQNRVPLLSVLVWWLLLCLLSALAFPWMIFLFSNLRDRGYGLARMLGLLLWAYPAWALASFRLVRHTALLLWTLLLLWSIVTAVFAFRRRATIRRFLKKRWPDLLRIEIIFAVLFLGWVIVRYQNPDFYHLVTGGEKPMDLAYLTAVIKSSWFPPYDPWFAGGAMNYYYFGFVLVGSLIETTGIVPSVAYNLAVPTLFAMTGAGAYTLASNLAVGTVGGGPDAPRRARRAGLWAVVLVVLLGNLGEIQLLVKGLAEVGAVEFESLIPGYELLVSAAAGFWKVVVKGQTLPFRAEWWYWNATRIIPAGPGEGAGPINEFPLFTYLYGDLHAHAIALPLTQIALGIALHWSLREVVLDPVMLDPVTRAAMSWTRKRFHLIISALWRFSREMLPMILLAGLVAGALKATNTWDYPTYFALMLVGFVLPLFFVKCVNPDQVVDPIVSERVEPAHESALQRGKSPPLYPVLYQVCVPVLIWVFSAFFFHPFDANYVAAYGEVGAWTGRRTSVGEYLLIHGQFVIALVVLAAAQSRVMLQHLKRRAGASLSVESPAHVRDAGIPTAVTMASVVAGTFLLTLTLAWMGVRIAWIAIPLGIISALLVLSRDGGPNWRVFWFWVGTALAITLLVEVIVLKGDLGRMNTVFKFYLQAWMLFAITAAVAQERLWSFFWSGKDTDETRLVQVYGGRRGAGTFVLGDAVLSLLLLLLLLSLLYPLFAVPGKLRDRWVEGAPRSLDGTTALPLVQHYENGQMVSLASDYALIRWMQENVVGSPTIMEMNAAIEYITWGNRVSIYTGLPSIVGWRWHQVQQRLMMPAGTVELRQLDVRTFYDTTDPQIARRILQRYKVGYVVLSPYERMLMAPEGLVKFDTMVACGWLEKVYDNGQQSAPGARLYKVNDAALGTGGSAP